MGRGVLDIGENPSEGSVMKLVGNFFISSIIEILAEGMSLGEKNGVARSHVVDLVSKLFPGNIAPGRTIMLRAYAISRCSHLRVHRQCICVLLSCVIA